MSTVAEILSRRPGATSRDGTVADAVGARNGGFQDISIKLTEMAAKKDVEPVELKRLIRRMLTLMLAGSESNFERRETIKMLSEVEGYKKLILSPDQNGGGPGLVEEKRLARLAGG